MILRSAEGDEKDLLSGLGRPVCSATLSEQKRKLRLHPERCRRLHAVKERMVNALRGRKQLSL